MVSLGSHAAGAVLKQSFELCNEWLLMHSDMLIPIYTGNKEQYDIIIQMAINTEHGYTG